MSTSPTHAPFGRLRVEGTRTYDGENREVLLRGVNLQFRLGTAYTRPRAWDTALLAAMPKMSVVRAVVLHWDDNKGNEDCYMPDPPYVNELCVRQLEDVLQWSSTHRVWAIVTLRGEGAATHMFKDKASGV